MWYKYNYICMLSGASEMVWQAVAATSNLTYMNTEYLFLTVVLLWKQQFTSWNFCIHFKI